MIDSLRPYAAMKDSGVPWLGEVPAHWQLRQMKTLVRERIDKGHPEEPLLAATQTKGVVLKEQYENRTVVALKDLHLLKLVQVGDFVISLRSFQGGIEYARERGIISPAYTVLFPTASDTQTYLARLFKSAPFIDGLALYVTGIRQGQNIDYEKLGRAALPLPPPTEQAAIVRFLDHADLRIKRYIRAKQQQIALLKEQRHAIINSAVTQGLDPNVRTRPSRMAWLGDVPEHWEVVPFKRRVGFQEGPGIMAVDFRDEGVPLLRISCLRGAVASLDGCNFLDAEKVQQRWAHFKVRAGDYLLSASASTGSVVLADETVAGSIPYTGIIRLWPAADRTFMPFVRLYMDSQAFQNQIHTAKAGVGIEHFGPTHLRRMWIALPPIEEQRTIVEFVERSTAAIAATLTRLEDAIRLLRELRTRLTADVVTGKLDVRQAAAALPDDPDLGTEIGDVDLDDHAADESADVDEVLEGVEA